MGILEYPSPYVEVSSSSFFFKDLVAIYNGVLKIQELVMCFYV